MRRNETPNEWASTAWQQEEALVKTSDSTHIPNAEIAIALAQLGFAVLALHHPISTGQRRECSCFKLSKCAHLGKHPRYAKGTLENGAHSATTNPDVIRSWWVIWPDANIGIATGRDHGLLVLDIDPRHGGVGTLADLQAKLGPLPQTVECLTGGGGRHLYFKHPEHNVKGSLGTGVDVQSDGVLVVAHGSLHASGKEYCWEDSSAPECMAMSELPEAWKKELFSSDWERDEGEDKVDRDDRDDGDINPIPTNPSSVVNVVPVVPINQADAMPGWNEDRVIGMTVPKSAGQHDRKTNDFARGVKFNLGIQDITKAHPLFKRWWALARPHCQEKDEDAAWSKVCRAFRLARIPLGTTSAFPACVEAALKAPFPPFTDPQPGLKVKQLAGACREMARSVGGSFKLSCHQVARAFNVSAQAAWDWFRLLEDQRIVKCVERGRRGVGGHGAAKFEYIGTDLQPQVEVQASRTPLLPTGRTKPHHLAAVTEILADRASERQEVQRG